MENKMATSNSNNLVNPNAREAMNRFKMEAASEMGVNLKQGYNGDLTSRQAGSIGGQMVKKDTVINLRVSKGPEEAATPVVTNLTQDQAVLQDEQVTLSISAYASDDGTLRYAWYMSTDGGYENAALVSRSREGNTTCAADTSVPGTYYYFCVVENSLGDDTKTTKSNMIEVVVQEKTVEKTIEVNLPSKSGLYEITVYVDGVLQYGPASVSITDDRSVIVEVTVRGKGTLPVDVYLDGAIYDSQLILFE